ncbi:MAG: DUF1015 domain-containing protein [Anaerolineaceae bacterium]|nr:DUF1015 domain-containing protein [Anaerolineaceae bacterium]
MKLFEHLGIQIPDVLLPENDTDYSKWAVIACDQFTAEPEYWEHVRETVGGSISTLNIILPEVFLGTEEESQLIETSQQTMRDYLNQDVFTSHEGFILVERSVPDQNDPTQTKKRHGIILALDLEQYDFNQGSQTLIRATEGTIIDRLPPRMKIRRNAAIEAPHILVLIDDSERTVIEPLVEISESLPMLYDFDLQFDSGHLRGFLINQMELQTQIIQALEKLSSPDLFYEKYDVSKDHGVLLFAMGDGNHSLATAKAIWEERKHTVGMDHPSRFALVEVENVHDDGLLFEPIHRVLMRVAQPFETAIQAYYPGQVSIAPCENETEMTARVDTQDRPGAHAFGWVHSSGCAVVYIDSPATNLPVGSLQNFLDDWKSNNGFKEIDYVHGTEVLFKVGKQESNAGFYLPAMDKSDLFKTVILDGALPRKTFSMGEAREKRFYVECRKIVE